MIRPRRPAADALPEGLTFDMLDILSGGWSTPAQPGRDYGPDHQRFEVFELSDAQWRALWQQHRALVLDEWNRRGGEGLCWAQREFEGDDDACA